MSTSSDPGEPLPIWFFVGLILLVYGAIILGSGLLSSPRPTVLAETRPALWWGGVMVLFGLVFLTLGWRGWQRRGAGGAGRGGDAP